MTKRSKKNGQKPTESSHWQLLKRHYSAVRKLDPLEQENYLNEHCAKDNTMRSEIEAMLESRDNLTRLDNVISQTATEIFSNATSKGDRIGAYQIARELGRGGMGTVWLATRSDDEYHSNVAIKVMHGLSGEHARNRFLAERQMLANLNHPNISRLLDGGTTSSGTPYVVMEYVEGLPIDQYCDQHKLTLNERIELFCAVCDAVQYAHRNLIVHRDIKPENILVTNERVPKLLDFGIAKLLSDGASDESAKTVLGQSMLTPKYASPEQVLNNRITTTSDIYSLGVLLNKLLTGSLPYKLENDDLFKIAEAICEKDPLKPSSTNYKLRGDLDNIVLRALRKKPESRYASVDDLSADLSRHLNRLPVQARPATLLYRTSRFVSRNPVIVALGALTFIGLLTATVFSRHQMQQAIVAKNSAEFERSVAVNEILRTTLVSAKEAIDAKDSLSASRLLGRVSESDRSWEWSVLSNQLDQSLYELEAADTVAAGIWKDTGLVTLSARGNITWRKNSRVIGNANLGGSPITLSSLSQNGEWLLAVRSSPSLQLWNVATPSSAELVFETPLNAKPVDIALSFDGSQLAAVSANHLLQWNTRTKAFSHRDLQSQPKRLSISGNGTHLGVTYKPGQREAYSIYTTTGQIATTSGSSGIFSLALSPDGKQFATSESGNTIRLRETATNRVLDRFVGHRQPAHEMSFSADGQWLVSGSADLTLRYWPTDGSENAKTFMGLETSLRSIQTDSRGRLATTLFTNGKLKLWDATDPTRPSKAAGRWVEAHPDSSEIYTLNEFGLLQRYDLNTLQLFDQTPVGVLGSSGFTASKDGSTLAVGERGKILLVDSATLTTTAQIELEPFDVISMSFSSNLQQLVALQSNGHLSLLETDTGELTKLTKRDPTVSGIVAFSPVETEFVSAIEQAVTLWDSSAGEPIKTFEKAGAGVLSMAYNHQGNVIATGWNDGAVRLIDAKTLNLLAEFLERTSSVTAVAFSPDDTTLASGSSDAELWIWNVITRRPLINLNESSATRVETLTFTSDGAQLVGSFSNGEVRSWHTHSSHKRWRAISQLAQLRQQQREPVSAQFEKTRLVKSVAKSIRKNNALAMEQKRAALQLALTPPTPTSLTTKDPFDGHALSFNGGDDHVLVDHPEGLLMQAQFTIEAWVKPQPFIDKSTPSSLRMLINKEGEYQIAIRPDGSLHWTLASSNGWMGWVPTRYRLTHGQWAHLAFVRDTAKVRFYLNGELIQEQPVPESIGDEHLDKNEFRIGGRQHTPSSFYGEIDEVRVWKTARSQVQIQETLWINNVADQAGLIASWSFDEGEGSITSESRGSHTGSVKGALWKKTAR